MQSLSSILTGIAGVWGDLTDQEPVSYTHLHRS